MTNRAVLSMLITVALPAATPAQQVAPVRYEVSVGSLAGRLLHATAQFPTTGLDTLRVSLPAWSPGSYTIANYARYVRHFVARDAAGQELRWDRLDKDTWRIPTGGTPSVTVAFDVLADTIDLSHPRVTEDFAVFLGTNLFVFQDEVVNRPAEVRFRLPPGWDVMTALRPAGGGVYTAPDYHELADAVTFLGAFSRDSLQVDGAWLRLAVWPTDAYTPAVAGNLRTSVERMVRVQNRLMGGPPYEVYTVFFAAPREPINFGGGLEHSYSHFNILPAPAFADPAGNLGRFVNPLLAHEFFHLWNVKRIRPAELWPYDYRAEQFTPLLWWSEGVTDYYADVTNLRAGLWSVSDFIASVQGNVDQAMSAPEPWSVEDGSLATWIDEVYVNSSQLYYPKGSLLGLLLDVSIRHATDNRRSLDDVIRALNTRFAQRARGFTTADLLSLLTEFGMPDAAAFYRSYVDGREPLPLERILPSAGLVVERQTTTVPFVGIGHSVSQGRVIVNEVTPGSAADAAGVRPGDELVRVGDVAVRGGEDWGRAYRSRYGGKAGEAIAIVVRRAAERLTLPTSVRERSFTRYTVSRAAAPSPRQAALWRGIAAGDPAP